LTRGAASQIAQIGALNADSIRGLIIGINLRFRERIHLRSRSSPLSPPPRQRGEPTGEASNGFPGSYVRDKRRSRNKMASCFSGESPYLTLIAGPNAGCGLALVVLLHSDDAGSRVFDGARNDVRSLFTSDFPLAHRADRSADLAPETIQRS